MSIICTAKAKASVWPTRPSIRIELCESWRTKFVQKKSPPPSDNNFLLSISTICKRYSSCPRYPAFEIHDRHNRWKSKAIVRFRQRMLEERINTDSRTGRPLKDSKRDERSQTERQGQAGRKRLSKWMDKWMKPRKDGGSSSSLEWLNSS